MNYKKMNLTQKEATELARTLHADILNHFQEENALFVALACVMSAGVLLAYQAENDPDFDLKKATEGYIDILKEPVDTFLTQKKGNKNETRTH